jgi:hypothetical protein
MEQIKQKSKKKGSGSPVTERLTLRKEEQERLEAWVQELNARFDGMIRLTKSDLANFLIRHHSESLNDEEAALIEIEHFDELRWMNWALIKIREAKKQGLSLTLQELMEKRRVPSPAKKIRKKLAPKSANDDTPLTSSTPSLAETSEEEDT